MGYSDENIASIRRDVDEWAICEQRERAGIIPSFKMVDTCAAEFAAATPYYYSTYRSRSSEISDNGKKKVAIIGGGPIRIGQGIEFDYCCVHGVMALQEEGVEAIMINNNPETVSTDYDISDRLYFEPLELEDVLNVLKAENVDGVICQYGGQTSVNLAIDLEKGLKGTKTKILGTTPDQMDVAEDRKRFTDLMRKLGVKQPPSGTAYSYDEASQIANEIGYPVLVRPSYVLGGRGMEIVYSDEELKVYMDTAVKVSRNHPVLIDKFISEAVEIDVDSVCDGEDVYVGGILEHIEYAGCHSGDATMAMPPYSLSDETIEEIVEINRKVALALEIKGLMNLQLAYKNGQIWMIEANPRASRTIPFISKATGVPLAKIGVKVMLGKKLKEFGLSGYKPIDHYAVKESVFAFLKLPGVDPILTPEMKSTGEVMGIDPDIHVACLKALTAAGTVLPTEGGVYITVCDADKPRAVNIAKTLVDMGFKIYATKGTSDYLRDHGVKSTVLFKHSQNMKPSAMDIMREGGINLLINTPSEHSGVIRDGHAMRRLAVELEIPYITTMNGAEMAIGAIAAERQGRMDVKSMQEYHQLTF